MTAYDFFCGFAGSFSAPTSVYVSQQSISTIPCNLEFLNHTSNNNHSSSFSSQRYKEKIFQSAQSRSEDGFIPLSLVRCRKQLQRQKIPYLWYTKCEAFIIETKHDTVCHFLRMGKVVLMVLSKSNAIPFGAHVTSIQAA